jgi:Right handed beta helix region
MSGQTYYIDLSAGDDANDGLTPSRPLKTYATREFTGGDTLLFKRGTVVRDMLHTRNGSQNAPITYSAYGEGPKPVFLGSAPAGNPDHWVEERPSLWRYTQTFPSEVCNLIFNGGESCGNLRWQIEDLLHPGEWHYTGIGLSSHAEFGTGTGHRPGILYLYSPTNPGRAYKSIECALWGQRQLAGGQHDITIENLSFQNGGVHGYQGTHARHITIRNCEFRFIGGAVWHRERRIRFGNGVEFWDGASDITVEGCLFDNIYDSGVTHQGGGTRNIPERLYFRKNLFMNFGMAAYEFRDPGQEVYFEHNTCINAGGGFSMQGDAPPRQSEIYPQPMGHHVFIWHVDPKTQPGHVYIRHNIFTQAPYGSAIYSIIDPADEQKFILDHNLYWQTAGEMLIHMTGRSYRPSEFTRYQAATGQDAHSQVAEPHFVDPVHGDYHLRDASQPVGIQK